MTIGHGRTEMNVPMPPAEVYPLVLAGMREIGKVSEEDPPIFLRGSTRFGLQRVRLRVNIEVQGQGSAVAVEGLADDVWGLGARRGIKKLLAASGLLEVERG